MMRCSGYASYGRRYGMNVRYARNRDDVEKAIIL
jgi:hypothetical protein